jgi:two-component system sensor histidine kinase KdpD
MVLILTIIALIVEPYISSTNIVMLYLIGVVVAALTWGLWFAIFTSGISVLVYDFVFVPPFFSFRVSDTEYLITFAAFLIVGVVISLLVIRTKEYGKAAQRRDDYTSTLFALSLDLASVNETKTALEVVSGHIMRTCHCLSTYLLPVEGRLGVAYANGSINMDEKEITAASWTYFHGLTSGKDTDTLASASLRYYPLRTPNGIVGVMGIQPEEQRGIIMLEQERLILAFASQIAMAIERNELWNQIRKNEMMGQPNDHSKCNGRTHS